MPFRALKLKPGVDLNESPTLNEFQIVFSNLIRFVGGLAQQLGGWLQKSAQAFVGTCRGLHGWADLLGNAYLAIGTEQRLQLLFGGQIVDITPIAQTDNVAVNFSTVINTPAVTIVDASYSPVAGDWVYQPTQVAVGGLIIYGYNRVTTVVGPTSYTITLASNATATVNNGGAVPAYTTANTSSTVSVLLAAHGLQTGDLFVASVSTTVATVVISGTYSVTRVDANHFTIVGSSVANANTTASENAGNVRLSYLLASGAAGPVALTGYGIGNYGAGDYGLANTGAITQQARQWSLDHWGQDLIASPSLGKIYLWVPPTVTPATVISGAAPLFNISVFVNSQIQIILSLGAEVSGSLQPLLVRWCDQGNFTAWVATATNQAGSFLLSSGSTLVGGLASGLGAVIWTDTDAWSVTYLGFPLVFGFNKIALNCGLIAQRACGVVGSEVFWLSPTLQFFKYTPSGGATVIDCPVWDFFGYNLDTTALGIIHCAVNSIFNEVTWFFQISPLSALYQESAPLGYVKYNYVSQLWDYGVSSQYQRTAWVNQSPVGNPIGADPAGLLQEHEVTFDANGSSLLWSWQSGFIDLDGGEDFIYADQIIPDWLTLPGNPFPASLPTNPPTFVPNVLVTDYPGSQPTQVYVPQFTAATGLVPFSARGRQISFGFAGSPANMATFSRLGAVRIRYAKDGRN